MTANKIMGFAVLLSLALLLAAPIAMARGTVLSSATNSYYVIVASNYTAAWAPSCTYTSNGMATTCSGKYPAGTGLTALAFIGSSYCGSSSYVFAGWNGIGTGSYGGKGIYYDCVSLMQFTVGSNIIETAHYSK